MSRAFGIVNKTHNDEVNYNSYLQNLSKLSHKLKLYPQDDLYKILYNGRKYTAQKVGQIYQNIIQMQQLAANCELCENERANERIGGVLKAVEPMVDSYLSHRDSDIWPLPITETVGISYGFNVSQKNQAQSLDLRPRSLTFGRLSSDFSLGLHRFGDELANDQYLSTSAGIAWHRDSFVLPTLGFGYQYETRGDKVYQRDVNSLYGKGSLLDQLLSVRFLYRLDTIEHYAVTTRGSSAIVLTADVAKICQMILPRLCR